MGKITDYDWDKWITGDNGQDQFKDEEITCSFCGEQNVILYETTKGNLICDDCINKRSLNPCQKCDRPMDENDYSFCDDFCDNCCEGIE